MAGKPSLQSGARQVLLVCQVGIDIGGHVHRCAS